MPGRGERHPSWRSHTLHRRSQIVHHGWAAFLAEYETVHRPTHGPLRPDAVAVVEHFYRCGDLAFGFTRLQCPDCGSNLDAGKEPIAAHDTKGRQRLAEYLLRAPFSLEKKDDFEIAIAITPGS